MMRRLLVLGLLVAVVAPVPASAQTGGGGNPFGPLPQQPSTPPEQPEPKKLETKTDDDGLGGTAFWLIMGTTGLIFLTVAFFITRDMRRTVGSRRKPRRRLRGSGRPAADAADALADKHRTGSQRAKAKAQKRAKTKAARQQRRKTRSR